MEDDQHEAARAVGRPPDFGEASARGRCLLRQPARAFGDAQADPPNEDRAGCSEQHHPAPAVQPERSARNQQPRQQRDHRHGAKLDGLVDGEGAAAQVGRHKFGKIGVDSDQFDAHADAGDEAPEVESEDIVLERHDDAGDGVPEQRVGEDGAAAEAVGDKTDERGADEESREHGGHETRDAGGAEEAGVVRQDAGADQAGGDIAGEEDVVELEEPAERDQRDAGPDAGWHRL